MNKFCTNCGNEINENAVVCVKCGVSTNNNVKTNEKIKGNGLGIASLVLGIFAILNSLGALLLTSCLLLAGEYFIIEEKIVFGILFYMFPIVLFIIGLVLGFVSRNKIKNGVNLTGLLLNFISLGICLFSIGILCVL